MLAMHLRCLAAANSKSDVERVRLEWNRKHLLLNSHVCVCVCTDWLVGSHHGSHNGNSACGFRYADYIDGNV